MDRPQRPNRQRRGGNNDRANGPPRKQDQGNRNHNRDRASSPYSAVPAYASITPGTPVSIVLKEDQPTGHQVQGLVADLLTRGDHPRGVKVRLRDGRVGRVQKVLSSSAGLAEQPVGAFASDTGTSNASSNSYRHVQDVRNDEYMYDENKRTQNLGAYFSGLEALDARDAEDSRRRAGERESAHLPLEGSQMATCPVCHVFEGDEMAVAHHVEEHFADNG